MRRPMGRHRRGGGNRRMAFATIPAFFEALAHAAGPAIVDGLWQGAAVALGIALCLKITPRISAAQRFALWAFGFAAVAALPLLPLVEHRLGTGGGLALAGPSRTSQAWFSLDARWAAVIAALWLIASTARAIDLLIHTVRLRRLWVGAVPVDGAAFGSSARRFQLCATQSLDRPSVIGFFAPRILIPNWLLPRLTPGELEQIVLHEAEHLRRRDDWTNLLQKVCLVLFPLNPALWWMERQLARQREMACDEAVVRITQAPRAYAACLAGLAERGLARRAEALSLGAWGHRSELGHRVHSILRRGRRMHPVAARVLVGGFACSLLLIAMELARCPQLVAFVPAQNPEVASAQLGDAVLPARPRRTGFGDGVYALPAKAILSEVPAARGMARVKDVAAAKSAAGGGQRAALSEPRAASPLSAHLPSRKKRPAAEDGGDRPQTIVLTAWEQVETTTLGPAPQNLADYDTQVAAGPTEKDAQAAGDNAQKSSTTSRVTVTRLVFKVLPSGANIGAKSGTQSRQPAAIPIGDGWFVIQL